MAGTSYTATEEMTNINRVSRLLMCPCTDQLRDLLWFYIHPASFPAVVQGERSRLRSLTPPQRNLILPNIGKYSGKYKDMDISLLYILLRNICAIPPHSKRWRNTPDATDRSVSANIERIRLARNRCAHSTGGMSKAYFNQIWLDIKAAVVDMDKVLENKNKYQKAVDFIRNDTMDPERDKQYREQLLEQMKDIEAIRTQIQSLESTQQGINERVLVMESSSIPPNIKEQHKLQLETWKKEDAPFHEIHSFPNILDKVQSQQITTILGSPGSGKTTTARHLALRLQTDYGFEIVPVDDITEIKQYGHPKCKQLFILDDVIGVWGFKQEDLAKLDKYSESIFNVLSKQSKILFTCRKAVYNEAKILFTFKKEHYNKFADLKSFALAENYIVDLENIENRLNDQDRTQMLKNHCIQNSLSLIPEDLSNVSSTVGILMYPLLCKLFCSDSKYQALGKEFFEKPYDCILNQFDCLKGHKQIQYASLVLCMFCPNKITEGSFKNQDSRLVEIKSIVLENCRVTNGSNTEIIDALNSMINTFTTRTSEGYSLIHDTIYEVLAFHYGNEHQEDMLQYMSSSFVTKKFKINKNSEDPVGLNIELHKKHYLAFAERLLRDLKCLELHEVFKNEALKEPCICEAFINELKKLPYCEIKNLFFTKLEDTSKIFVRSDEEINERRERYEWHRQELLMGDTRGEPNIRVISWVIAYGHNKLLEFLFDLVIKHKESIWHVMDSEIPVESGNSYISDLKKTHTQYRYLILSCFTDNVEVVKLILKHSDLKKCLCSPYDFPTTPLNTACQVGHESLVDLLIEYGANCNQGNTYACGETPLLNASEAGHSKIVKKLISSGAKCDQSDHYGTTPLHGASERGHVDVVLSLIKLKADLDSINNMKRTPLYCASENGHADVVNLLIQNKAKCDISDKYGRTPLHAASAHGHDKVVDLLIKYKADLNLINMFDQTPLHSASGGGHDRVVDLLIKNNAKCNESDKNGKTPLHYASERGHDKVVYLLIKHNAKCNESDKDGKTPLHYASEHGHVKVVDLLIEHGTKCNIRDECDRTPLHAASAHGHDKVVDLLLIKYKADLNPVNMFDRNPLYFATVNRHYKVADFLIKHGAKCNQYDKDGKTPLHATSEL